MSTSSKGGVLAIDHGTKRTGFAATDALHIATFALDTFHGAGDAVLVGSSDLIRSAEPSPTLNCAAPPSIAGEELGAVEVRTWL